MGALRHAPHPTPSAGRHRSQAKWATRGTRTRRARTAPRATASPASRRDLCRAAGGSSSGLGATASIRQSGRSTRFACGATASNSAMPGSDNKPCSCAPCEPASGTSRTSQPKPRGSRSRCSDGRGPSPSRRGEPTVIRPPTRPATRPAREANRRVMRRSRLQTMSNSGARVGLAAAREATARHSPSMIAENRSDRVAAAEEAAWGTNGTRT